jgi:selenium-binding protein 1
MPGLGDELHHFGWNACSAALCPYAPHPHIERRYLLVPGLRSSRMHVIDVKNDPIRLEIVRVIPPEEIAARSGYSRPHTIHCGPDAIYVSALGAPDGGGLAGFSCSITKASMFWAGSRSIGVHSFLHTTSGGISVTT